MIYNIIMKKDDPSIRKYSCISCGEVSAVKILYGYPSHEMMRLKKEGLIELGGCIVSGNDPNYRCKKCGHTWRGFE